MARPDRVEVNLKLPFLEIRGAWQPDENQRRAAWEMYIQLVTRIAVTGLQPDEGLLREALTSLYSLFDTTRAILTKYGPGVAQAQNDGELSFGFLAVAVLNTALRPVLAKWHHQLLDYETHKPEAISSVEWERQWEHEDELRVALREVHTSLTAYANLLAEVAQVPSLIVPPTAE